MAHPNKLILTRDQIAAFATDPRAIKQIESLFTLAQGLQELNVEGIAIDAGAALAGVNKLAGAVAQLAQDGAIEASNALAIAQAAERALNAVSELAMVGATLPPIVPLRRKGLGAFSSNVDQVALLPNVAYPVTFDTVGTQRGVWRDSVNTSRIYVADGNFYNFQFSAQLDNTAPNARIMWIWPRVSGVDVPDSASQVRIQGNNAELVAAWNWVLELNPGDYFELMYAVDNVSVRMQYFAAAGVVPEIPSVILTVTDNI
jgi:hypothetical protein